MDLSRIPRDSFLGRILRAPLAALPADLALPILQGPARGMRWVVGSGTHGCWHGSYEYQKRRALERVLEPGMTFYDIGANVGYYTLVGSTLVGDDGQVLSFEPLPKNVQYLRQHVHMNDLRNVRVIASAVTNRSGEARLALGKNRSTARLQDEGEVSVTAISIDDLVERGDAPPPNVLKIDVEGAETAVLEGARVTIELHQPIILLATHGWKIREKALPFLLDLGYTLDPLETDEFIASPAVTG